MDTPKYCFRSNNDIKPQKWISVPFMSVIDKIIDFRGRTPKKLGYDWSKTKTDYLALSALNVKQGYIEKNLESHYGTQELYNAWMKGNELKKGQILFTTEAPMGNVAQVPDEKPYILSQRTIAFNCSDIISNDFLAHLLRSPNVQKDLAALATGGTAKGVSQKSLNKLFVSIPNSRIEQQKIADFLSSYDEKISIQRERVEALERRKKGLLQKVFSQEIRFKADDGSEFSEWERKTVESCCLLIKDGTHGTHKDVINGIPLLSAKDIFENSVHIPSDSRKISELDYKKIYAKYELKEGDVLITIVGTLGRTAIIDSNTPRIAFQRSVAVMRPSTQLTTAKYLNYVCNSHEFQNEIEIRKKKGAQPGIYLGELSSILIPVPSLPEQQKIADFFSAIDEQINVERERLTTMEIIKKGLLQGLFC